MQAAGSLQLEGCAFAAEAIGMDQTRRASQPGGLLADRSAELPHARVEPPLARPAVDAASEHKLVPFDSLRQLRRRRRRNSPDSFAFSVPFLLQRRSSFPLDTVFGEPRPRDR